MEPRSPSDGARGGSAGELRFAVRGIPVRVSPWFWLVAALLGYPVLDAGLGFLLAWMAVVFVSILVHELGHAAVALGFGYAPRILLYQFGGLAFYRPGEHHTPGRSIAISLAGPAAGFVLLLVVLGVRAAAVPGAAGGGAGGVSPLVAFIFGSMVWVNLWWGVLNLLPVTPLDGGQICRQVCYLLNPRRWHLYSHGIGVLVGGGAALYLFTVGQVYAAALFALLAFSNVTALRDRGAPGAPA